MLNLWARIPVKPTDWGFPPYTLSECQLCCVVLSATHSKRVSTMKTMSVLEFSALLQNTGQPGSQLHYWLIFLTVFVLLHVVLVACFFVCLLAWCFFFLLPALEQLACSFPPSVLSWRAFVIWVRLREVDWGRSLRVSGCVYVCVHSLCVWFGSFWTFVEE